MMIGTKNRGSITEDDTALLLQRYTATTILALLQEVSQFAGAKIDWNTLVKRTTTGIQSAREYQMLWRHLAYHDALTEKIENGAEPLDDDSDLEFELELSPNVTSETTSDSATAVKVLMTHGWANDPGPSNRQSGEAHLPLNASNGQALHASLENTQLARNNSALDGKQPLSTVLSSDGMEGNGATSASYPPRRKRKLWTPEEDMELIAAVKKCGEGNWANILKGDFKHDRTASQLSQRWAIIRKKQASSNLVGSGNLKGSTLSEAQLAAQAVSIAIDMPMMRNLSTVGQLNSPSVPATTSNATIAPVLRPPCPPKPRSTQKKSLASTPMKCTIQEVAVAAGARIANPSTAASLLKAAQSKNAVHIKQGSSPAIGARPSNIHYIRTASPVVSSVSRPANQGGSRRIHVSGQPAVSSRAGSSNLPPQLDNKTESPSTGSCFVPGEMVKNAESNLGSSLAGSEILTLEKAVMTDSKVSMVSGNDPAAAEIQTDSLVTEADENQKMVEGVTSLPISDVGEQTFGETNEDVANQAKDESQSVVDMMTEEIEKVAESSQPLAEDLGAENKELAIDPALTSEPAVEVETGEPKESPNESIVTDGEGVSSNPSS
ncbi:uncharacterized protein [Aristolochia californica]|uniref:uncharacterized protein n=1 Tax=Aristolochia californica TaxID=171875 RepID=UPI0035DC6B55